MSLATEFHLEKAFPIAAETKQSVNETFRVILETIKRKLETFGQSAQLKEQLAAKVNQFFNMKFQTLTLVVL